jgi:hypothetical protein
MFNERERFAMARFNIENYGKAVLGLCLALGLASIAQGGVRRCPSNYVPVPGDIDFKMRTFCIMKYEAKCGLTSGSGCTAQKASRKPISQPDGTPWVSVSQNSAMSECASIGKGFHLITNDEWMTVASNAANVGNNWDGGTVGTNGLNRGHSDGSAALAGAADSDACNGTAAPSCTTTSNWHVNRRTHTLGNNEAVWDLAGNVLEWTSYFNDSDKPGATSTWYEYSALTGTTTMPLSYLVPTNAVKSFWVNTWNSTQNIGKFLPGSNSAGGALRRGGGWNYGTNAGLFLGALSNAPTYTGTSVGFRCVAAP